MSEYTINNEFPSEEELTIDVEAVKQAIEAGEYVVDPKEWADFPVLDLGAVMKSVVDATGIRQVAVNQLDDRIYVQNQLNGFFEEPMSDTTQLEIIGKIERYTGNNQMPRGMFDFAITALAGTQKFNPIHDMFKDLPEWDKTERVADSLIKIWHLETPNDAWKHYYTVLAYMLFSSIAVRGRNTMNYVKQDSMFVITGPAGKRKSSFIRALVWNKKLTTDGATLDLKDTDNAGLLANTLVNELAEFGVVNDAQINKYKRAISAIDLTFRPAYARYPVTRPFHNTLIATTNDRSILSDLSGNRKFILFDVMEEADTDLMTREYMEQIYAEILYMYDGVWEGNVELTLQGIASKLGFNPDEITDVANEIREEHGVYSPLVTVLNDLVNGRKIDELATFGAHLTDGDVIHYDQSGKHVVAVHPSRLRTALETTVAGETSAFPKDLLRELGHSFINQTTKFLESKGFVKAGNWAAKADVRNERGWWVLRELKG